MLSWIGSLLDMGQDFRYVHEVGSVPIADPDLDQDRNKGLDPGMDLGLDQGLDLGMLLGSDLGSDRDLDLDGIRIRVQVSPLIQRPWCLILEGCEGERGDVGV
jgi:hypothetical protein